MNSVFTAHFHCKRVNSSVIGGSGPVVIGGNVVVVNYHHIDRFPSSFAVLVQTFTFPYPSDYVCNKPPFYARCSIHSKLQVVLAFLDRRCVFGKAQNDLKFGTRE